MQYTNTLTRMRTTIHFIVGFSLTTLILVYQLYTLYIGLLRMQQRSSATKKYKELTKNDIF